MIIYTGENEIKLVQSVASASTLLSSLTGEIREYIISKFPKGFFKAFYIDTSETVTAQNRNEKYNKNLNKVQYPSLSITPQISLDDPIGGMEKSNHISSPNLYLRNDLRGNYKKLVIDPSKKFSMFFTSDYLTTNFNFRITTNKYIQNVDMAHYLKSRFQVGFFQFLNKKYINTEIPKTYIKIIANILDLDPDNTDDMRKLRRYLISTGVLDESIKLKTNLSTGKVGFYVNELNNFLTLITDLDAPGSIIREGMSEGEYTISFRVQVSAWLPNAFIFSINKEKFDELDNTLVSEAITDGVAQQDEGFYSTTIFENVQMNRRETTYFLNSRGESVIGEEIFHSVFTYEVGSNIQSIELADYL
jgi:hypothetical protein